MDEKNIRIQNKMQGGVKISRRVEHSRDTEKRIR